MNSIEEEKKKNIYIIIHLKTIRKHMYKILKETISSYYCNYKPNLYWTKVFILQCFRIHWGYPDCERNIFDYEQVSRSSSSMTILCLLYDISVGFWMRKTTQE